MTDANSPQSPRTDVQIPFTRTMRVRIMPERRQVEIPAPPRARGPTRSLIASILLPVVTLIATVVVMAVVSGCRESANGKCPSSIFGRISTSPMALMAGAIGAVSTVGTVYLALSERRRGRKGSKREVAGYRNKLERIEDDLDAARGNEFRLRTELDPDVTSLVSLIANRGPRLWERSPSDPDFLHVRIGLADQPTQLDVRYQGTDEDEGELAVEGRRIATEYRIMANVPFTVPLPPIGVLGLAGLRNLTTPLAHAMICQIVTHHSPTEVSIPVVFPREQENVWAWVKWLPHTRSMASDPTADLLIASSPGPIASLLQSIREEIDSREARASDKGSLGLGGTRSRFLPVIVLFVDDEGSQTSGDLSKIMNDGPAVDVLTVVVRSDWRELPKACGATATFMPEGILRYSTRASEATGITPDMVRPSLARALAVGPPGAGLAPLRVADAPGKAAIPLDLRLLDLLGSPTGEVAVAARWSAPAPDGWLRAPIGLRSNGDRHVIDIRRDGPHGLVAGTTGAGKSELLQTIVASLAVSHHPERLNFVLVDYKGGAAFRSAMQLPHTAGVVTDLDPHLARRALTALNRELKRREEILKDAACKDIIDYERLMERTHLRPLANLLIVIDEFATLKSELPEFIDGLVDIARRGRSLGVHLMLATQKPAGVITDNIKANTNLRIALRVTDAGDSTDIIESNLAAFIPRARPGRAYYKVGTEPPTEFQTARVGGPYRPPSNGQEKIEISGFIVGQEADTRVVERNGIRVSGSRRSGPAPDVEPDPPQDERSDLDVIAAHLTEAAERAGIARPPSPWPEPLPTLLSLGDVEQWPDHWLESASAAIRIAFGRIDEPQLQRQRVAEIDLEQEGHLLAIGVSGTGKSTLLRTIATSLASSLSPSDLWIYVLDYGSRALRPLETLPHCGGVIYQDELERTRRLFKMLGDEAEERKRIFASVHATTLNEYRRDVDASLRRPYIVVLLDNYAGFEETFRDIEQERYIDELSGLLREGRALGISFIVTASRRAMIRGAHYQAIPNRIALRQAEREEMSFIGLSGSEVPTSMPAGRAFVSLAGAPPVELQIALPTASPEGPKQARELADAFASMSSRAVFGGATRPRPVRLLPDDLKYEDIGALRRDGIVLPLGLDEDSEPVLIDLSGDARAHFLIGGPDGSGRSGVLLTAMRGLNDVGPAEVQVSIIALRPSPLWELRAHPAVRRVVDVEEDLGSLLDEMAEEVRRRITDRDPNGPRLLLLIDDVEVLTQNLSLGDRLDRIVRRGRDARTNVIAAGRTDDIMSAYGSQWLKFLRQQQSGFLLWPDAPKDDDVFGVRLPRLVHATFPIGRGYVIKGRAVRLAQIAVGGAGARE